MEKKSASGINKAALKKSQERISVRLDRACEDSLQVLELRLQCSRSEAIRYAILHIDSAIADANKTIGSIDPAIQEMRKEMKALSDAARDVIRIPSFFEYRVRGMVEDWDEMKSGNFLDAQAVILMGRRYAIQYGKLPDPSNKKTFGRVPDDLNASDFIKKVSFLINAQIIRGYGDKE